MTKESLFHMCDTIRIIPANAQFSLYFPEYLFLQIPICRVEYTIQPGKRPPSDLEGKTKSPQPKLETYVWWARQDLNPRPSGYENVANFEIPFFL